MKKQVYNPFLPLDEYIPDGEPHIFGDRVYLYGSHDLEGGHTFCMGDYTVYSAPVDDLSDWRLEGVIYSAKQDPITAKNALICTRPTWFAAMTADIIFTTAFRANTDSAAITGRFPLRFAILRQADTNIWDMFIIPTVRP